MHYGLYVQAPLVVHVVRPSAVPTMHEHEPFWYSFTQFTSDSK